MDPVPAAAGQDPAAPALATARSSGGWLRGRWLAMTPNRRAWLVTGLIAVVCVPLLFGVRDLQAIDPQPFWPSFVAVVVCATLMGYTRFDIQARGGTQTIYPAEFALPMAVLFLPALPALAAIVIGGHASFLYHRPNVRTAFNLVNGLFGFMLVLLLAHGLLTHVDPGSGTGALALLVACLVNTLATNAAVRAVMVAHAGSLEALRRTLMSMEVGLVCAAVSGCMGLVLVVLAHGGLWRTLLVAPPAVALFLAYRMYADTVTQRLRSDFLRGAAETLLRARSTESALVDVAERTRVMVGAARLEVALFADEHRDATAVRCTDIGEQGRIDVDTDALRTLLAWSGTRRLAERGASPVTAAWFEGDAGGRGMVAELRGADGRLLGALIARAGSYPLKRSHLELLSTVAVTLVSALENERLNASLTAETARSARLQHQALHDPLTGLVNRVLFEERLQHALVASRRTGRGVAVLYLDLDGFKPVNDTLGHAAGDELLVAVAQRFSAVVRDSDTLARLGGDEFAVVLEDVGGAQDALRAAERILLSLHDPFLLRGVSSQVGVSIGVAVAQRHSGASALCAAADEAMYTAKRGGRGRVVVHDGEAPQALLAG